MLGRSTCGPPDIFSERDFALTTRTQEVVRQPNHLVAGSVVYLCAANC